MVVGGKEANSANLLNSGSQADAAKMLNVSTRSVAAAAKVLDEGDDELVHAVERGDIALNRQCLSLLWKIWDLWGCLYLPQHRQIRAREIRQTSSTK